MKTELLTMPLWQMTGEQFLMLQQATTGKEPQPISTINEKKYVYGIKGIAEIFHCSIPTASRIKASHKIDKAITQLNRLIVVDSELALELAGQKNGGRK